MKVVVGFSGGKDSTLALYRLQNQAEYEIDSLLVTLTEGFDRVSIHGVRYELLKLQSESLGIPLREVWIPQDCPNEKYQELMGNAVSKMKEDGVTHMAFGDFIWRMSGSTEKKCYREQGSSQYFLYGKSL